MYIIPAIDLYNGCAVRLKKGDYEQMTVYSNNPPEFAEKFEKSGAEWLHVVDLEGAKDGTTSNIETVKAIVEKTGMKVEIGGGIRNDETVDKYINIGVSRVIRDGLVSIKGWLETTELKCLDFCEYLEKIGVKTIICTDISKDGMLGGTNTELYKKLNESFNIDIVASGGVSTIADIKKLASMNMYGAILGKALYENAVDLSEAVKTAKEAAQ